MICAAWPTQSKLPQAKNTFEVREEPLDLLLELHRDAVSFDLGEVARSLSGVFVLHAGDLASVRIWAASGFGRTGLTDLFQGAALGCAFTARPTVRVGSVAAELL